MIYLLHQITSQEFHNEYYDLSDIFEIEETQQTAQIASLEAAENTNRHTEINTDIQYTYYQNFQQNFEETEKLISESEENVEEDGSFTPDSTLGLDFDQEYDYNHNYEDSSSSIYGHSMSDFDQIKLLNNIANSRQVHN